jgi:hypothetical protein
MKFFKCFNLKFGWEVKSAPKNNDANPNLEGWV